MTPRTFRGDSSWSGKLRRRLKAAFPVVVVASLGLATPRPAAADAPVAPAPESLSSETVAGDPHILPASLPLEPTVAMRETRPGAVPLSSTPRPTGGTASSTTRPLPDWRLLAALGAAFAAVAAYRAWAGRTTPTLPPDVFELLGEAPLGGQQSVRVVRFGPRTLLIGLSSAGCQTLAEIADPQATECIVSACRGTRRRSASGKAAGAVFPGRSRGGGRQVTESRE
jgi:hypothetical protein